MNYHLRALIYSMLNGNMTRDQRKEIQSWVIKNPKRHLNHFRKVCWQDVPVYNMLHIAFPGSLTLKKKKQTEKLTLVFPETERELPFS